MNQRQTITKFNKIGINHNSYALKTLTNNLFWHNDKFVSTDGFSLLMCNQKKLFGQNDNGLKKNISRNTPNEIIEKVNFINNIYHCDCIPLESLHLRKTLIKWRKKGLKHFFLNFNDYSCTYSKTEKAGYTYFNIQKVLNALPLDNRDIFATIKNNTLYVGYDGLSFLVRNCIYGLTLKKG